MQAGGERGWWAQRGIPEGFWVEFGLLRRRRACQSSLLCEAGKGSVLSQGTVSSKVGTLAMGAVVDLLCPNRGSVLPRTHHTATAVTARSTAGTIGGLFSCHLPCLSKQNSVLWLDTLKRGLL